MTRVTMQSALALIQARKLVPSPEGISEDGVEREYVFFGRMTNRDDLDKADSFEDQEQYRLLIPVKDGRETSVRIRKSVRWYREKMEGANGKEEGGLFCHDPVYHLTIKSFKKGQDGVIEAEHELSTAEGEAMIKVFREQCEGDGLIKRRYFFKCGYGYRPGKDEYAGVRMITTGMMWEVDVPKEFKDSKDLTRSELSDSGWVKLDLEVKRFNLEIKTGGDGKPWFDLPFPIRLDEDSMVWDQPGRRSKENEAQVRRVLNEFKPDA